MGSANEPGRRWAPFAVAALLTVVLAGGVSLVTDRLLASRSEPAPQLKTVPATTMARLGLTLSPSGQPPYCTVAGLAVQRSWLHADSVRCAVTRDQAEAAARRGGPLRVIESVLARVSWSRSSIRTNHLDWVVVMQDRFGGCCLVLVDGYSGTVVSAVALGPPTGGRPARALPPGAVRGVT
jgi:hypothetical protein